MIRKVITSYDNFSAMIAIMIRIKFKPFPACRYAKTGNGGYTFGLHIIRRRGYCSTGLIPRISSSGSPSLRTNWSVASITTSTPSSTRLSDTTFVFSPLSSVSSSPAISSSSFRMPMAASSSQFTSSALKGVLFSLFISMF